MNKLVGVIIFAFGTALGAVAAYKYLCEKNEQRVQEEIASVKKAFDRKTRTEEQCTQSEIREYEEILRDCAYDISDGPHVIPPEEFGEMDEYETISLTYYDDGVLADDNLDIVENADEIVGLDSLTRFGEYEDDSVFVRNDERKCDYEILLDKQSYEEVLKTVPYKRREA